MTALRITGFRNLNGSELVLPGDTFLIPTTPAANAIVGASTLTAAQLVSGMIYRSGSVGAYTDILDTSSNILAALAGNNYQATVGVGLSFETVLYNSVAFVQTLTLGTGQVTASQGLIATVPASSWRKLLFTCTSNQPSISLVATTVNGQATVIWVLPPGQVSEPIGPQVFAANIAIGANVVGTNIPVGTTVLGITQGLGGTIGVTLSQTATGNGISSLTFGPSFTVNSLGSGTL